MQPLFGDLSGSIVDEDALRAEWSDPDRRERSIAVLGDKGYDGEKLTDMRRKLRSTWRPGSAPPAFN